MAWDARGSLKEQATNVGKKDEEGSGQSVDRTLSLHARQGVHHLDAVHCPAQREATVSLMRGRNARSKAAVLAAHERRRSAQGTRNTAKTAELRCVRVTDMLVWLQRCECSLHKRTFLSGSNRILNCAAVH